MATTYQVKSIFGPTVQGEGPHQGRPCVFLRLSGCNAWDGRAETRAASACPYCDTDFRGGKKLDSKAILEHLQQLGARYDDISKSRWGLVISGGEPLLQVDEALLAALAPHFPWVDIETNGTRAAPPRPDNVTVVCSPKRVPGQDIVVEPDAWKILIPAQEHFVPMALASGKPLWLQPLCPDEGPAGDMYAAAVQHCLDLAFSHGAQISVQIHKYLGVE